MYKPNFDANFAVAMKKLLTISVALLYLAVSCGLVVNMHYCMGELAEISYHSSEKDSDCGYCGMEDSDCCHDDLKVFKLDDTHKSSPVVTFEIPQIQALSPVVPDYKIQNFTSGSDMAYTRNPPEYESPSHNILFSVFRI